MMAVTATSSIRTTAILHQPEVVDRYVDKAEDVAEDGEAGRGAISGTSSGRGRGTENVSQRARGGRGRGGGARGRGAALRYQPARGYGDVDVSGRASLPEFTGTSGLQLPANFKPTCEADFFKLYFSDTIVKRIAQYTNAYAIAHLAERPSHANKDKQWDATNTDEIYRLISLLLFQAFCRLPATRDYWRTSSLFCGNYARAIIPSRRRFDALMCFLKVVDHTKENPTDRLRKVRELHDHMKSVCNQLYKPGQFVAIDERMIKSKARSPFKQYIKNKPVKWGFKQFAACDSESAILFDFELYTGQVEASAQGLTHDVVSRLCGSLHNNNHILFTDNYYTSAALATSLLEKNIYVVGTVRTNRQGFPDILKSDAKKLEKYADRGATRYARDNQILFQQWKDNRVVSMLSTVHRGNKYTTVTRNVKVNGQYQQLEVKQPECISLYNEKMGGVDQFNQHAQVYRTLRKTLKYWRSIVLDFLDIAEVNSFRMFEMYRQSHPNAISRRKYARHADFRVHLIRQLAGIDAREPPPKRSWTSTAAAPDANLQVMHLAMHSQNKKNCVYCWKKSTSNVKSSRIVKIVTSICMSQSDSAFSNIIKHWLEVSQYTLL